MVKSVRHLPHIHGDLSSYPRTQIKMPAMTAYTCKPRDSEMRGGDRRIPGSVWSASLAYLTMNQAVKRPYLTYLNQKVEIS